MSSTFSEIFQRYRKNSLVVDDVQFKVPYWAVDKMKLENFCLKNGISRPVVYTTWSRPEEIELKDLPNSFVIKPSNLNSSRGVMALERQDNGTFFDHYNRINVDERSVISAQRDQWNWVQKFEPHRIRDFKIMAQERVTDIDGDGGVVTDYKFWMIGDSVEYIRANSGGDYDTIELCFYDGSFQEIDVKSSDRFVLNPRDAVAIPHKHLSAEWKTEMLRFAENVARKVDATFCRVDLYLTPDGVKLGEITPTPGSPFNGKYFQFTQEYDRILGEKWLEVLKGTAERRKSGLSKR